MATAPRIHGWNAALIITGCALSGSTIVLPGVGVVVAVAGMSDSSCASKMSDLTVGKMPALAPSQGRLD